MPTKALGAVDTRQIVWCLYRGSAILGLFATTDNVWTDDAVAPTWRGASLPPLGPWSTLADRAISVGIPARTIAVEPSGEPRPGPRHREWLEGVLR
jgi:hypothetical protein